MSSRKRPIRRVAAVLTAVLAMAAAAPPEAMAQEEGLWRRWVEEVTERDKIEIPFAILFSIPPMIVTTPFWLAKVAIDKLTEDD